MEKEINTKRRRYHKPLPSWVSLVVWLFGLIVVWEAIATYIDLSGQFRNPQNYLPHLHLVIQSVFSVKVSEELGIVMVLKAAGITLSRAFLGFSIGIIMGFVLALLMDLSGAVEKIAFPYLMLIQMIPILGMAPIVYAITKDVDQSRIIIAVILTFYPISTNTLAGFKSVEKEKNDLMSLCAANKFQIYWKTKIPASLPYFFIGLKIAAPLAITAAILVDTLQGGQSLGCLLSQSLKGGMSRYVFWQIVFISAIIGVGSGALMGLIEKICCPYRFGKKSKKK